MIQISASIVRNVEQSVEVGRDPARRFGMTRPAICRYDASGVVYLFKCDADWEVIQDSDCTSVDDAMQRAAQMAKNETPN
jgi:hypothetical protein